MQKYAYMSLLIKKNNNCAWKGQNTANIAFVDGVIHTLFIYEASWEQSKGASFADRYADSWHIKSIATSILYL